MRRLILFAIFLTLLQIHLSVQNGKCQWIPTARIDGRFIQCFAQKGTTIFAGTGTLPTPVTVLFKTTNNGTNWTSVSAGLSSEVTCLTVSGANIFAGTFGGGIYISSNDGVNWAPANNGLTDLNLYSLGVSGSNIYAGTMSGGVFISSNNGLSWMPSNNGLTNLWIMDFAFSGSNIFAATWGEESSYPPIPESAGLLLIPVYRQ